MTARCHDRDRPGRGHRRWHRRRERPLPSRPSRVDGRRPPRASGARVGLDVARRRQHAALQHELEPLAHSPGEHGALPAARGGDGAGDRLSPARQPASRLGAGPHGRVPSPPGQGADDRAPLRGHRARGDPPASPARRHPRAPRGSLEPGGRSRRSDERDAGPGQGRARPGRARSPAHARDGSRADRRRRVADRHRPGSVPDRGRRQRRRHVGARGRAAGRARPADRPDGAPVPRDRGDPGDRGARRRAAAPAGGRRFLLPPTGSPRPAARPLRARGEAVRGRGDPAGLRRRPPAARRRASPGHRRGCDGARPRARPGRRRSDRQRSDYLHARREPAPRACVRAARLLARLRRELWDHASGWCGPVPGRVDRGGAAVDRPLGGGSATLRRVRHRALRGRPVRRHLRGRVRDRLSAGRPPAGPAGPDEPALRAFPGGRRGLRRPERVGTALLVRARGGGAVRPAELPPDELVRRRRSGGARRPRAGRSARALELLQVRGARPGRGGLPGSTVREPAPAARPDRALAAPHAARCNRVRRHRDAARARAIPRGERRGRRAPRSRLAPAPRANGWQCGHRGRHGEVGRADSGRAREPGRFLLA